MTARLEPLAFATAAVLALAVAILTGIPPLPLPAGADPLDPRPRRQAADPGTAEWTTNPRLEKSAGGWWPRAWQWNGFTGQTREPVPNSEAAFATWRGDGDVRLGAKDFSWWNLVNNAASVTQQGPPLPLGDLTSLTLTARMSDYGTTPSFLAAWTGIKFDIWLRDTTRSDRLLYAEMYFVRTGINDLWCADFSTLEQDCRHELVRELHEQHEWNALGPLDDYMVHLPAFEGTTCTWGCLPALAQRTQSPDGSTEFHVDLLHLLQRGTRYLGRTLNGYELIIAGATLESGAILLGLAGRSRASVNEIRVDYRTPPPASHRLT